MKLVIVESPSKAKTINKYLGNSFKVIASFGHIRDIPSKNGSVLPEEDFLMKYSIPGESTKHVAVILEAASKAEVIYLATDPDREGEAISWHIAEVIKAKNIVKSDNIFKRVAFNEITKKAIIAAINNPRDIDIDLVNSQQARRALDYLVGFTLSPLLWRKLPGCKSAGRVQSVALRLICERQAEVEKFKKEEYWTIILKLLNKLKQEIKARLTHINGKKLEKLEIKNSISAEEIVKELQTHNFYVEKIEKKQQKRNPPAPFITSSLQQEASRKLGFSAKKTMQVAQKLYEGFEINGETQGLITYMRTDGVTLASDAIKDIRTLINSKYGKDYLPSAPRVYKSKAKNAQEAHEAIRPTNIELTPDKLKTILEKDYYRLYELIWKRTMACQMENVVLDITTIHISSVDKKYSAKATGSVIVFDGFYKIYQEGIDEGKEEENNLLPIVKENESLITKEIKPDQHFTEPPPKYSEASLVKKLEELGIGRPSTYASIISVLQDRKYVSVDNKRFIPEELGRFLSSFLTGYFSKYVEYDFTAELEEDLDKVAAGDIEWKDLLRKFWLGFNTNITQVKDKKIEDIIVYIEKALESHLFGQDVKQNKNCPACADGQLTLRLGKYGAFLSCHNYPTCQFKKQITTNEEENKEGVTNSNVTEPKIIGIEPKTKLEISLRKGPYGFYLQLGEALSKSDKPKRASLKAGMTPETVTLDEAIILLSLPMSVGIYPSTMEEILMNIGKYGPYLKYENRFIKIPKDFDPYNITLPEAIRLIDDDAKVEKKPKYTKANKTNFRKTKS